MRRAVLLIENSEQDVRAIKGALRDGNLPNPVVEFSSGSEAQAWLAGEPARDGSNPGLVMVNIHAPKCGGLEFLEWLRDQPDATSRLIVALAERSQLREVVKAYERGAHTFLVKPVHPEDIRALVKTYPQQCG